MDTPIKLNNINLLLKKRLFYHLQHQQQQQRLTFLVYGKQVFINILLIQLFYCITINFKQLWKISSINQLEKKALFIVFI